MNKYKCFKGTVCNMSSMALEATVALTDSFLNTHSFTTTSTISANYSDQVKMYLLIESIKLLVITPKHVLGYHK